MRYRPPHWKFPASLSAAIAVILLVVGTGAAQEPAAEPQLPQTEQPAAEDAGDAVPSPAEPAAASGESAPEPEPPSGGSPAELLADQQRRIQADYEQLETLMLRLAELLGSTDARRAAVLRKAVSEGKDRLIEMQLERVAELLAQDRLSAATTQQQALMEDMQRLLQLLLSENEREQLAAERARIDEYLKRVGKLIRDQQGLQGQTERAADPKNLADQQQKLAERTGELGQSMKKREEAEQAEKAANENQSRDEGGENNGGEQNGEQESPAENAESPSGEEKQGESPSQQGEQRPGGSPQGESPQGETPQGDSQQSDAGRQSPEQTARERIEAATERMKAAQKRLAEAQQKAAADEQQEAIRELENAKAELEEVLRQLREEEMQQTLVMLEERFRKMLRAQVGIRDETVRLAKAPAADLVRQIAVDAGRLGREQSRLVVDAERILTLLAEDGTAVAMPEAVGQMRDDMRQVADRLASVDVGPLTQSIEQDIIDSLEELIAATEQAQEEHQRQQDEQGQQAQQGEPEDPSLVDQLAELRIIRSLQVRVNRRTDEYSKLVDGEQAQRAEILSALAELAEREDRIFRATRDIVVGRNQ